jgi:hypothetical protein
MMMTLPKVFVCVPRAVCASWWPKPWDEMLAAAHEGVDGMVVADNPRKLVPDFKSTKPNAMKEVEDYPYVVREHMVFRQGQAFWDGSGRTNTAMLHTQGW